MRFFHLWTMRFFLLMSPFFACARSIQWCRYSFGDMTPPRPFGSNDLARVSLTPLLAQEQCDELIAAAVEDKSSCWHRASTSRYGTDRLPALLNIVDVVSDKQLVSAPNVCRLLNEQYLPRWEPLLHDLFCDTSRYVESIDALRLKFARIVKYEASLGEVELGFHQDGPLVTCNIALNSPNEYEGGGTAIKALRLGANIDEELPGGVLRPVDGKEDCLAVVMPAGHALVHPGHVRHAGAPIQSGVRWLLGLFFEGVEIGRPDACSQKLPQGVARVLPSGAWLMRDGSISQPQV